MPLINQVQLGNTFNEFRTTVNDISNTINSGLSIAGDSGTDAISVGSETLMFQASGSSPITTAV